jgi:carbon monoxide dehydrogenase subunit G
VDGSRSSEPRAHEDSRQGVDGTSEMVLSDGENGSTVLNWSSDITVVGTIASLAARLMGVVTQKLTDAFFEFVRKKIER